MSLSADAVESFEWSEDEEKISAAMESIEDLHSLLAQIKEAGGVNKTMAVTIESVAPETLPKHCPVESFTESVTRTNLKATVEAVQIKTGGILRTLWEAIISLIKKVFNWIKETISKAFGKKKKISDAAERAKVLNEAKDSINSKVSEAVGKSIKQIEKDVEAEVSSIYSQRMNALCEMVAEGGQFKQKIRHHGGRFIIYLTIAERRLSLLKSAINQLPRREEELYRDGGMLKRQILSQMTQVYKDTDGVDPFALREEMRALYEEQKALSESKMKEAPSIALANRWLSKSDFNANEEFLSKDSVVKDKVDKFADELKALEKMRPTVSDQEIYLEFRKAYESLKKMLEAYTDYMRSLNAVYDASLILVSFILDYPKLYLERLAREIKENGTVEDKRRITEIVEEARRRVRLK